MEIVQAFTANATGPARRYCEALTTDVPGLVIIPVARQGQPGWASLTHQSSGKVLIGFDKLSDALLCARDIAEWVDWTMGERGIIERMGVDNSEFQKRVGLAAMNRGGERR